MNIPNDTVVNTKEITLVKLDAPTYFAFWKGTYITSLG